MPLQVNQHFFLLVTFLIELTIFCKIDSLLFVDYEKACEWLSSWRTGCASDPDPGDPGQIPWERLPFCCHLHLRPLRHERREGCEFLQVGQVWIRILGLVQLYAMLASIIVKSECYTESDSLWATCFGQYRELSRLCGGRIRNGYPRRGNLWSALSLLLVQPDLTIFMRLHINFLSSSSLILNTFGSQGWKRSPSFQ